MDKQDVKPVSKKVEALRKTKTAMLTAISAALAIKMLPDEEAKWVMKKIKKWDKKKGMTKQLDDIVSGKDDLPF